MPQIKQISEKAPFDAGGYFLHPPEIANLEFSDELKKLVEDWIDQFRKANLPQRIIEIYLNKYNSINEGYKEFILFIAKCVLSKNIVNLDIFVNSNPRDSIQSLIDEINKHKKGKNKNSVRIKERDESPDSKLKIESWELVTFLTGGALLIGGAFLPDQSIKTKWFSGPGLAQSVGALLMLPSTITKIVQSLLRAKNSIKDSLKKTITGQGE